MQVALDPAPLLVAGARDPRPRLLDLGELDPQLDPQAGELDHDGRRVEHPAQQIRRAAPGSCSSTPTPAISDRARPSSSGSRDDVPAPVRERVRGREPEEDLGARVGERDSQHRADLLGLRPPVAHVVEERAQQPHALEAGAREAAVDEHLHAVAQRAERERRPASVANEADGAEPPANRPASSATSAYVPASSAVSSA